MSINKPLKTILIILAIIASIIIIEAIAISQLKIDDSPQSILTSSLNSKISLSLSNTDIYTNITIINPTIIPIIATDINYNIEYKKDNILAANLDSMAYLPPNKKTEVPIHMRIDNANAIKATLTSILTHNALNYSAYVSLGPIKIPLKN